MSAFGHSAPTLPATYLNGRSAKAHSVVLSIAQDVLLVQGESMELRIPVAQVQWPERSRHGQRVAHFSGGGLVKAEDAAAWDTWYAANGQRESLVVKMQQSWRSVLVSTAVLLCLLGAAYQWGLPLLAMTVVAVTPYKVDSSLGESSLAAIDSRLMLPSQLATVEQGRIQEAWTQTASALPAGQVPPWRLVFRKSRIGANAFALPGGTIILTDEMVKLVDNNTDVLCAVLAHELGHLQHRDGLRMLVEAGVLGSVSSVLVGDFSGVLAALPALLGQAHYSRHAEHEADVFAVRVLQAAHISPMAMVNMFEKIELQRNQAGHQGTWESSAIGIAFASHPADAERIAFFRQAAR